ncbi:MAG: D-hexose-6-phosphate mutarotase, partial [Campylobacterota bacterium]|nr:D-hexose-6-phosphate mutarotase [Campylobacterota bacterium]
MITLKELENGFTYIEIANEKAQAKIALQGAHVYHYQRTGEAAHLWISRANSFEIGKAIRGGIPICWPWFGISTDPALPQHGFARTMLWNLIGANDSDPEETKIILRLQTSDETLSLWPHHFDLYLHITVGDSLTLALTTINRDKNAFELTSALHTYFSVSKIGNVHVEGLDGKPFFDALSRTSNIQEGDITI